MDQKFEARGNAVWVLSTETIQANGLRSAMLGFRLCTVDETVEGGAEVIAAALNRREIVPSEHVAVVRDALREVRRMDCLLEGQSNPILMAQRVAFNRLEGRLSDHLAKLEI